MMKKQKNFKNKSTTPFTFGNNTVSPLKGEEDGGRGLN